jgi:beta-aspartyl-dipeptidase (metallo-type)
MLSGKAGVVSCHLRRGERPLDVLREVLQQTGLPVRCFLPTQLEGPGVEDGVQWISDGGYVDFAGLSDAVLKVLYKCTHAYICAPHYHHSSPLVSAYTIRLTTQALAMYFARGVNLAHVIVSSHAYGALDPSLDPTLAAYRTRDPHSLLALFRKLFFDFQWPPERILPMLTQTPAAFLKLAKGKIEVGGDADILLLERTTLSLRHVFARGCLLKSPTHTHLGMFE